MKKTTGYYETARDYCGRATKQIPFSKNDVVSFAQTTAALGLATGLACLYYSPFAVLPFGLSVGVGRLITSSLERFLKEPVYGAQFFLGVLAGGSVWMATGLYSNELHDALVAKEAQKIQNTVHQSVAARDYWPRNAILSTTIDNRSAKTIVDSVIIKRDDDGQEFKEAILTTSFSMIGYSSWSKEVKRRSSVRLPNQAPDRTKDARIRASENSAPSL